MSTRLPLAISALSLLVVGCGAAATPATVDRATADHLASRTAHLADQLDAGDGCGARDTANAVVEETRTALSAGSLTEAVASRIIDTTRSATEGLTCEPTPEPTQDPPGKAKGHDEDKGKPKGKPKDDH